MTDECCRNEYHTHCTFEEDTAPHPPTTQEEPKLERHPPAEGRTCTSYHDKTTSAKPRERTPGHYPLRHLISTTWYTWPLRTRAPGSQSRLPPLTPHPFRRLSQRIDTPPRTTTSTDFADSRNDKKHPETGPKSMGIGLCRSVGAASGILAWFRIQKSFPGSCC